ncbi:hypothetical protein DX980_01445 [Burkholderia gladioli]|nr:hypothetical protein DX980_01445 [Burkholderia gladioli]
MTLLGSTVDLLDLDQRVVCGIRMYSRLGRPAVLRHERCMAFADQVPDSLGQRLVPHVRGDCVCQQLEQRGADVS